MLQAKRDSVSEPSSETPVEEPAFGVVGRVPIDEHQNSYYVTIKDGLEQIDAIDAQAWDFEPGTAMVNGQEEVLVAELLHEQVDGRRTEWQHARSFNRLDTITAAIPRDDLETVLGIDLAVPEADLPELLLLARQGSPPALALAHPEAIEIPIQTHSWPD